MTICLPVGGNLWPANMLVTTLLFLYGMHGSQFFTKLCNLCLVKVMFSLGAHSTIQLYIHCTCACIVSVYLQNGVHEYKMQAPIPIMSYSLSVAGSDGHSELAVSLSLPGWLSELSPTHSWISEEYKMQV